MWKVCLFLDMYVYVYVLYLLLLKYDWYRIIKEKLINKGNECYEKDY